MQLVQAPLPAGTVKRRRYAVEMLLGRGNSGEVYLVRDQHSKHARSTLFVLKETLVPDTHERHRLLRAADLLRELRCGGLPRVYQVFNDDKSEYVSLLLEYIEGQNLEELRQARPVRQFSWDDVQPNTIPIIAALSYLHHQPPPIIHGDIKPANIILRETGLVRSVLVDFSLARQEEMIPPPAHAHLPGYRAPEYYAGEVSIQSDIYGLGATFYTLLTGIVPINAFSRRALCDNTRLDPLKPVNEVAPAVPAHVGRAIDQAMALDAHNRFSSVDEFWEALRTRPEQTLLAPGSLPVASSHSQAVPAQAVGPSVIVAAPGQQPAVHISWKLIVPIILLIGLGFGSTFWFLSGSHLAARATIPAHGAVASPSLATSTAASGIFPSVAGTYRGTILDVATNTISTIVFVKIQQNQARIRGYLTIGSKPQASGYFSGAIDTARRFQFTVIDSAGHPILFFEGVVQSPASLSGDYYGCRPVEGNQCFQAPEAYGIWNVVAGESF